MLKGSWGMADKKVLITGCAGFIGFHLSRRLLAQGCMVVGLDDLGDYYDPALKRARLSQLSSEENFRFYGIQLQDEVGLKALFEAESPTVVINLAAQVGVRHSIYASRDYIQSNLVGFGAILDACVRAKVEHLVYASSSSVYGQDSEVPFKESARADRPLNLYAATKRSNELMAESYACVHGLPCTGLRFFTVYGPWGRPDMAPSLFTGAILAGVPIKVFNHGKLRRDFTYVGDVVEALARILAGPAERGRHQVFNVGQGTPVALLDFIKALEGAIGRSAVLDLQPMQAGDMVETYADVTALERAYAYRPATPLKEGLQHFVNWFRSYYKHPV
jgi:UDP-glucuronate 4-epimerase